MSNNIDFKALWNRGEGNMPDINEIIMKANRLNRGIRKRIWWENITLSATAIFIIWVWWYYQPQMVTTKIGIVLVVVAIVGFLTVSNQQIPLLTDSDVETDSRQYLAQLIRVKQKQEFLGTTIMTLYFIFLGLGVALYMFEYVRRGSVLFQMVTYGATMVWMAISWFYLAPKRIKKLRRSINEVIEKLEAVNGQMDSPES